MNRSADPALRSLLPTHNGPFPPQLTDLAGSLLAQSRHRASALKAEEEIARPYACAHIACDRYVPARRSRRAAPACAWHAEGRVLAFSC